MINMKFMKNLLLSTVLFLVTIFCVSQFMFAWDSTMSNEELVMYLKEYPNDESLVKIAKMRNINIEEY